MAATMATPEMLPVCRHVDDVLIENLTVRVDMSTRMLSKVGGDNRRVSKANKFEASEAVKMIFIVWQVVSKIDSKGLCSLHLPNGGFKVTHGCSTTSLQLSSLALFLCLREAPLLALCRIVRFYLILRGDPGDMRGGINITNEWRTVW